MPAISPAIRPVLAWCLLLGASAHAFAEEGAKQKATWYETLDPKPTEVEARGLEILSLQISKLPRDTFGHGEPPVGPPFVSSWVVGSGTGLYGAFHLARGGTLVFQDKLSSLERFVDDRGRDLTVKPEGEKINEFFDVNKRLQVEMASDQRTVAFTLRGYRTPTAGATTLKAKARFVFLSCRGEKSMQQDVDFKSGEDVAAGPVRFRIYRAEELPTLSQRHTRNEGFGKPRAWGIKFASRSKPIKSVELLGEDGKVLKRTLGTAFEGQDYTWYVEKLDAAPTAVRVTWYEKWQLLAVPVEIATPLGI